MWEFLQRFEWIIQAAFVYLIVRSIFHGLHFDFGETAKIFFKEFSDLAEKKITMGSINALSIIVVFIFGVLIYIAYKFKFFLKVIFASLPERSAVLMENSITLNMLLLCIALIALASWVAVYLDNRP